MRQLSTRILAAVAALLLALHVKAQTPPEGNAHPSTQNLSATNRELENPFGVHNTDLSKVISVADKAAFAEKLNLDPLRSLAVFHNGRVKVLETLAMETVARITGRKAYVDYIKTKTANGENVKDKKFDSMFTLLDLTIDPAYYMDKPLIGIEYLPLREAFLEREFPAKEDDAKRDRWKRVGRITPMMLDKHMREIASTHMSDEAYSRAIGRVEDAVQLFMEGKANMVLVAPAAADAPWIHLSALESDAPARKAAAQLGDAWRSADAAKANAAIAALAAELPRINAGVYPTGRRALENTYNRVNAFEWGYWTYFVSLLLLLLAFGTGRKGLAAAGVTALALALSLHAFGFVLRCMIAERFAIQNQFESMTGVSLFAATVGTVVMILRRQWLFGAAAAAVGFMVLLTATQSGIPGVAIEREAAILNTSVLLKYHVTTVLVSYGLISLGFVCSLFFLGVHYFGAREVASGAGGGIGAGSGVGTLAFAGGPGVSTINVAVGGGAATRARLLADLDTAQMIILQLAFWTLGVGILLGAWWADHSWGRWWAFDPKETWALLTWIVYLIVVHVRVAAPQRKGITTAWLSVVGFGVMLWTYFGVNLLLPGLHAYA